MKLNYCIFIVIFLLCIVKSQAQINPSNNKLAVDVSTYHVQNLVYNYDSSFAIGENLGMNQVGLFINWSMLETAPNTFDFSILDIANVYYPSRGIAVDLNINPINTNRLETPPDLDSIAFNNTLFISRYKILLDSVKTHTPALSLSSLIIGSEIGAFLGSDSAKWAQYTQFYDSVLVYAKTLWPGLNVAVELQFTDFINYSTYAHSININSDYIGVSYYPIWSNFTVKPLYTIPFDMNTLVSQYPLQPICFYQYGFPSSPTCNSSDSLQAAFIAETFTYWDYYAANIRLIDFTWMHDLDTVAASYYETYYGITDTIFFEFLRTIGLREWNGNGTDKPSLNELRCQAYQRGYNNLSNACSLSGVNEMPTYSFTPFPNPFCMQTTLVSERELHNATLTIYNCFGQIVKRIEAVSGQTITLNRDNLTNGIFWVQITENNHILGTITIVVEN
ncbi:MAG: T9SS type A sorting domain-containing protein [Bacteroidales bacterium]|nr:T9SS type A sorting domain-containing protein [Bacteroidales bacterium]